MPGSSVEPKPEVEALGRYLLERIAREFDTRDLELRGEVELRRLVDRARPLLIHLPPGDIRVSVQNHAIGESERTVLQLLIADQPFLVDTFRMALERLGLREKLLLHSVLSVEREEDGSAALVGAVGPGRREAFVYAEVALVADETRRIEIEAELLRVYRQAQHAVQDHGQMVERLREHAAELQRAAGSVPQRAERIRELVALLEWLAADHFVFLGYRRYELRPGGEELEMRLDAASGLGVLREQHGSRFREPLRGGAIPDLVRSRVETDRLLFFDKARSESVIHRRGRMDSVLIKTFGPDGRLSGFGKFVGLLTFKAMHTRPSAVPWLRTRLERVLEQIGPERGSHRYKAAVEAFDSLPLEFLFSFDVGDVAAAIERVLRASRNRSVEIAVVRDPLARSFFVSVILPRETYRENLREDLQRLLVRRYQVSYLDHRSSFVDEESALIHFFCSCERDVELAMMAELERDLTFTAMRWEARLEAALRERHPADEAQRLAQHYAGALPESYRIETGGEQAVGDIEQLERLRDQGTRFELAFARTSDADPALALRIYQRERPYLTDLLPRLDRFGLRVIDAKLTEVRCAPESLWIASFAIERAGAELVQRQRAVLEGLDAVLRGVVEDDVLNLLILGIGLSAREVHLLRAYLAYASQIGVVVDPRAVAEALLGYPEATRALVRVFCARFNPVLEGSRSDAEQEALQALRAAREPIHTAAVDSIFELVLQLVRSSVRTDYFVPHGDPSLVAFKLDPAGIDRMPPPRPWRELFVYSPEMRGMHLRCGPIARGGIRFSDRGADLRGEILGLMKTQMVKNGLIVPLGSKGGFVLDRRPERAEDLRAEVDRQYARFVRALLRLTDNLVSGRIVPPQGVVRHDGDDPYLVVAPDKGTAHLSNSANAVALELGFWLGDAFASGGSCGYDHKVEAITARGAWTAVKRHFLELGVQIEDETFSVAAIGDMSGDVCGNGLLLARNARLLAAFDHRHVFVDPDPDPERSWRERRRLFELPASSWRHYDETVLSAGGGVFDRSAKAIPLSLEMRAALGVQREWMSGEELVQAVLRMPVDLLWNGGIGTYVKASGETHAQVGDRANDRVRVDACELRARVVAEGGNLGFTPLARVEYALRGGRLHTDAVDNCGGVALSDLEVNYKILLDVARAKRPLPAQERTETLNDCVGQANAYVLAHCASQSRCVSMDALRALDNPETMLGAAAFLERRADLDPQLEALPSREQLRARASASGAHASYTRPELCVLLGYTKLLAKREMAASELVDHPSFRPVLHAYFPDRLRQCFPPEIEQHPLRREITATCIVNRVIDQAGVTLIPDLSRTHGVGAAEILAAYYLIHQMLEADHLRWAIERQDVPEAIRLRAALRVESAVRAGTRCRLGLESRVVLEPEELAHWTGMVRGVREALRAGLRGASLEGIEQRAAGLVAAGIDAELAREIEELPAVVRSMGVLSLVLRTQCALPRAVRIHAGIGQEARITWLLERMGDMERRDGWERIAAETLVLELLEFQRRITAPLLETDTPEADVLAALRERNARALQHIEEAAQDIEAADRRGLVPLAVMSQLIRRIS